MGLDVWALTGIAVVAVLTFGLGVWGSRRARTTSDFLVAGRVVSARTNAAAIAGEYLSAASFLGVAGLVMRDGADALWYPVGFTAGYLALLLFVAAPLRRSGAYTLPDFAEARLGSLRLRRLATIFVVLIGWLYLVPQLQGAGLTLSTVTHLPPWAGALLVAGLVVMNVLFGGMRAVTLVQAVQYWIKLTAIGVPAFVLCIAFAGDRAPKQPTLSDPLPPVFTADTTLDVRTNVVLTVAEPVLLEAHGKVNRRAADGPVYWGPGHQEVSAGTRLRFPEGAPVPVVIGSPPDNASWLRPLYGDEWPLFRTYSLIFATFLGTMGLPHVLVRFYTNPDGRQARQTTLFVLVLLGLFYLFPTIIGALSRLYVPKLLVTGTTDAAVLLLPSAVLGNWGGRLLAALTAAGAFAAFLSTSAGLVMSVAGVLSTDVLRGRVRDVRVGTVIAGLVPLTAAVIAGSLDVSQSVGLAFATAASTFCPLLVLGIWWRGLTAAGAAVGLVVGGGLSLFSTVATVVAANDGGWAGPLLTQPAAVTVPAAFLTMVVVSKITRRRVPADVSRTMLRLHAPDRLGFGHDRAVQRFTEDRARLVEGRKLR
uniref:Sodium:solute symporter family protein n=1 Tax=Streptoalloteichus tenebrarius (strain ATCC 17920 / DSM 40477 / JCM 4838 / CBS 697.72 / NBRC 16177 / NCIMB 11028 / NRRL B-12390 / A12253. 1 / ISP 5477) TaxID=1933 RepID=A0ABT1HYD5_STRSD|nr:cation acetate symporter [Streptoalloteichus tenebrarius]MCP2260538.1 Sodium:solute symporter family protein [Streptoalloteichus tenebrarius]BFF01878.1 cation acetate symporter [Streptoalloteichus tenebrarius]